MEFQREGLNGEERKKERKKERRRAMNNGMISLPNRTIFFSL